MDAGSPRRAPITNSTPLSAVSPLILARKSIGKLPTNTPELVIFSMRAVPPSATGAVVVTARHQWSDNHTRPAARSLPASEGIVTRSQYGLT